MPKKIHKKVETTISEEDVKALLANPQFQAIAAKLLQGKPVDTNEDVEKEPVKLKTKKKPTPLRNKKRQLYIPSQEIEDDDDEDDDEDIEKPKRIAKSRYVDIGNFKNNFKDNGKLCRDPNDDILRAQNVVVKNERPPAQYKKVKCSSCDRRYRVPVGYVGSSSGYYRCDRCTGN